MSVAGRKREKTLVETMIIVCKHTIIHLRTEQILAGMIGKRYTYPNHLTMATTKAHLLWVPQYLVPFLLFVHRCVSAFLARHRHPLQ